MRLGRTESLNSCSARARKIGGSVEFILHLSASRPLSRLGAEPLQSLATRAVAASAVLASTEYISKRIRRHLNDLERTNYTEPSGGGGNYGLGKLQDDDDAEARDPGIDAKEEGGGKSRKKQGSKAVRQLILYRKNLAQLLDESVRSSVFTGFRDATYDCHSRDMLCRDSPIRANLRNRRIPRI